VKTGGKRALAAKTEAHDGDQGASMTGNRSHALDPSRRWIRAEHEANEKSRSIQIERTKLRRTPSADRGKKNPLACGPEVQEKNRERRMNTTARRRLLRYSKNLNKTNDTHEV
jgi:hypothetical protein